MKPKKQINIEVGSRVKQVREAAGYTQQTFSELVGLGEKHISAIECGAVGLSLTSLQTICTKLPVPSDALIFGDIEKNDVKYLAQRLELLSPEQFALVNDIVCKVLIAFALNNNE